MMTPSTRELRAALLEELRKDLIGPAEEEELLADTPTVAYLTGILFPANTEIASEEDEKLEAINREGPQEDVEEEGILLAKTINPASLGLSFAVADGVTELEVAVSYGLYQKCGPQRSDGWQRSQYQKTVALDLTKTGGNRNLVNGGLLHWIVRSRLAQRSVTVFLVNRNTMPDQSQKDRSDVDGLCLYQPELRITSLAESYPFVHRVPENEVPPDPDLEAYLLLYRDCYEFAIGHGCAAEWGDVQGGRAREIWSAQIPSYELAATIPREMSGLGMMALGQAKQASEIVNMVQPLLNEYEQWIGARQMEGSGLAADLQSIARDQLTECTEALQRMKAGLELIQRDSKVFEAFRFANQAMLYQRTYGAWAQNFRLTRKRGAIRPLKGEYTGAWRPFQLAFILLNLPGVADPGSRERGLVDLLWFPTGGGKTEAYLGLIAFTLGLRRLQGQRDGKNADGGVTVIMRYTLRLLTTQQFQRAATLICACEFIRRRERPRWGERPFQIGLWVGSGATPNNLDDAEKALESLKRKEDVREGNPLQLTSCPWCGETLAASNYQIHRRMGALGKVRLLVFCPRDSCDFHLTQKQFQEGIPGELDKSLPVVLVDEDIYRQCPSLLMATIDKFARLPWQPKTMALFGMVDRYCPDHGYISRTEDHANHRGGSNVRPCFPFLPPELIIQDELHLISGPLGTLAGLYEAGIDQLCTYIDRQGRSVRPKIIASTATIRRAEDQVRGLFAREVRLFPPSGLSVKDSFFAVSQPLNQRPGRLYVGVCAPGRSVKTALVRVYALLLQVAGEYFAQYGQDAADAYTTLLGYFNSLRELGGALRLVEDDIVQRMRLLAERRTTKERTIQVENRELTSRIASNKIPEILSFLEKQVGDPRALDVLLATNMISVGVDINRLGLMVVNGQPKTSAEYIQATSRIGRQASAPGLVVTLFNWSRPRDVSHYERFLPYHEAMYRHVEATSVTPFAPRARDRALHAVILALARLLRAQWTSNHLASSFEPAHALVEGIQKNILERVSLIDPTLRDEVEAQLESLVNWWSSMATRHGSRLYYHQPNPFRYNDQLRVLMHNADEKRSGGSLPTLNSLRDVEGETQLFMIWE